MIDTYPYIEIEDKIKDLVWNKGKKFYFKGEKFDPSKWRLDSKSNVIKFSDYGKANSEFSWEIDYITPSMKKSSFIIDNMQPRHK